MPDNTRDTRQRTSKLLLFAVAMLVATVMWFVVSVNNIAEVQISLRLDYVGLPSNLVVTEGLADKMTVRVRGPQALLNGSQGDRITKTVDLSAMKPGRNIIALDDIEKHIRNRAFELLEANPRTLTLQVDRLIERVVPVMPQIENPLRHVKVECVLTPNVVTLRGPEKVLAAKTEVLVPVRIDPGVTGRFDYGNVSPQLPKLVTSTPMTVGVEYNITSGRVIKTRKYFVRLEALNTEEYTVYPDVLPVIVEVPAAVANSKSYMDQLDVYVLPAPLEPGQSVETMVRYRAPEGMIVQGPAVQKVLVRRRPSPEQEAEEEKQKQSSAGEKGGTEDRIGRVHHLE